MTDKLTNCPDCDTRPGQQHKPGCDVERCSVCGDQRISCGCDGHDSAFARWTGFYPGDLESKELGIDLNQLYQLGYAKVVFIKPKKQERQDG